MVAHLTDLPPITPEVRARTILAACTQVVMSLPEAPQDHSADSEEIAALVEWHGVPHLLVEPTRRPPSGPVTLTCSAGRDLGELVLSGACERPRPVTAVPGLVDHLVRHGCSPQGHGPRGIPGYLELKVVRVAVSTVSVLLEAPRGRGARRLLPVPVELFDSATPDLWAMHRTDIVDHLERHHQNELCTLARLRTAAVDTSAVTVRSIGPDGMALICLGENGVRVESVPFVPPLPSPTELSGWFQSQR